MAEIKGEKPRICIIPTGGEITQGETSQLNPLQVAPELSGVARVEVVWNRDLDGTVLSTRGGLRFFEQLAREVSRNLTNFDGIVVTTSIDGIQFMAPALSFALGPDLDRSVVVVGSNQQSFITHGEAKTMLLRAVLVAGHHFAETVIVSSDNIIRAASFMIGQPAPKLTRYHPYNDKEELGIITSDITLNHSIELSGSAGYGFHPHFRSGVVSIPLIPGLEPELYRERVLSSPAVVLVSEGYNTVPNKGKLSFVTLIEELTENNIPVAVVSRVRSSSNGQEFESSTEAEHAGAMMIGDMSSQVAITKLSWVLGRVEEEIAEGLVPQDGRLTRIRQWMMANYVGERGPNRPFTTILPYELN